MGKMANEFTMQDLWDSEYTDEHRRGLSDMQWRSMQNFCPSKYMKGDIIEFMVGGFGIIDEVDEGPPPQYSASKVRGLPFHATTKVAWHYEGDIKKLIGPSAIRNLDPKNPGCMGVGV